MHGDSWPRVRLGEVSEAPGLGSVVVVRNPGSGSADAAELDGVTVRDLGDDEDLEEVFRELTGQGVQVLGMVGGDGSVGCAAGVAADSGRVLLPLPGGTLNHFARELGLETIEDALAGMRAGRTARVDIAEVNGRVFVNNASVGVYGDLVRRRELLESRMPKRVALLVACARTLRRARPMEIEVDGRRERVFLLFVGNNRYTGIGMSGRESLQEGVLDLRMMRARGRWPLLAVLWRVATGLTWRTGWLTRRTCSEVTVRVPDGSRLAHDGEVSDAGGELVFRSRPGALRVIVGPES